MLSAIATRLYFYRLDEFLEGEYTAFSKNDEIISVSISKGYERVDMDGNKLDEVLEKLRCNIIKKEEVDGITIVYAYSPYLLKSVFIHSRSVNIMIALTEEKTVVGSPLIKGSF
jgi:hypothetical protein